jgi:hypothetical protein
MVEMEATSRAAASCVAVTERIGPVGVAARVVVGLVFLAAALWWRDPTWVDVVIGLVVMPAVAVGVLGWRARRSPARLQATSPSAHCLNVVLFLPLFLIPATAGGAFLFYGTSMLFAALRRSGGCEVTAIATRSTRPRLRHRCRAGSIPRRRGWRARPPSTTWSSRCPISGGPVGEQRRRPLRRSRDHLTEAVPDTSPGRMVTVADGAAIGRHVWKDAVDAGVR